MAQKTIEVSPVTALALAIQVYNKQGFIRSGDGFTRIGPDGEQTVETFDNKTLLINAIQAGSVPVEEDVKLAEQIITKFNGRYMLKKLNGSLNNFESGVSQAFGVTDNQLTKFNLAILASIPHMNEIDKKRKSVEDKFEELRFQSEFLGTKGKRFDVDVTIIDVKFIQSSGVFMISGVVSGKDIIKFWWRDQPDISDIIDGKTIRIRGTVNKHEKSKYTNCHETMLNRVKILDN